MDNAHQRNGMHNTIDELRAHIGRLIGESEITDEICDDLRTEVEQKDRAILSLVDTIALLARKLV